MNSRVDYGVRSYRFSHYSTFRPEEFLTAEVRFPPKTHSSLFHYYFSLLQLSVMNIIRYLYTCTVLRLAIMIFVHLPSYLTNYLTKLCMSSLYSAYGIQKKRFKIRFKK